MKQLFVTATDTAVGKTMISGLLLGYLLGNGRKAGYQKWIATGVKDSVDDLDRVRQLAGIGESAHESLELTVPYRLPFPASPHLASEMAGVRIDPELIVRAYENLRERYEVLLVEGVGGLLVPLGRDLLLADLLERLKIPTLLVARTGLGTLNHTLLSLEALRSRKIPVLGIICTDGPAEEETIAADNCRTLSEMAGVRVFGRLPWCRSDAELKASFDHFGREIASAL